MADLGYDVLGVESDPGRLESLRAGRVPFYEPGLEDVLRRAMESGRLRFTASLEEAARFADVHFLCVGTPQLHDSFGADMTYVNAAVKQLAPHVSGSSLLIGKSTVPVGTASALAQLAHELAPADATVQVAWNPEFLREGHAVQDTLAPDRLVFGVTTVAAEDTLRAVYAPIIERGTPVVVTDLATAELVKVSANAFLATKISFINAVAEICDAADADVSQLATAIGYDERIGPRFLNAGIGYGGGCLPKDFARSCIEPGSWAWRTG